MPEAARKFPFMKTRSKNTSLSISVTDEKRPSKFERFWPVGCIALLCVAAALWLHALGYTKAPVPAPVQEQQAAAEDVAPAGVIEQEEERAVELASKWEAEHPDGENQDPSKIGVSGNEVATYIARSYRLTMADARQITAWAVEIGAGFDVDPLLILAIAGTESSFNPKAKSGAGAEGLMQVMTRVHTDKFTAFGGPEAALEPYPNMVVGTSILSRLIARTGSVTKALKWYYGAANRRSDGGYSDRVFRERSRLLVAASGDSDRAVQLSRTKRTGPSYVKGKGGVKQLGYSEWAEMAEAVETRASAAGKARQLGNGSAVKPAAPAAAASATAAVPENPVKVAPAAAPAAEQKAAAETAEAAPAAPQQ